MDADKAPYFVVLAISAFAWAIGYFYETVITSPIIEFYITPKADPAQPTTTRTTIEIQNLSSDKVFPAITVWLRPSSGDASQIKIIPTAAPFSDLTNISSQAFSLSARVNIKDAQPHETYIAIIDHPTSTRIGISFDSGNTPVRFMQRDVVTTAIRWSQDVMVWTVIAIPVFLLCWLIFLICRAACRRRTRRLTAYPTLDPGGGP